MANSSERKQSFVGEILKCPNCGEQIPPLATKCPACGHEFRNASVADSVTEFSEKLNKATIAEKIQIVSTYPIPNTKEDIAEFLILTQSEVSVIVDAKDPDSFAYHEAWQKKILQLEKKVEMMFSDDPSFTEKVKQTLEEAKAKSKQAKKKAKKEKNAKLRILIMIAVGILVAYLAYETICVFIEDDTNRYDTFVEQFESMDFTVPKDKIVFPSNMKKYYEPASDARIVIDTKNAWKVKISFDIKYLKDPESDVNEKMKNAGLTKQQIDMAKKYYSAMPLKEGYSTTGSNGTEYIFEYMNVGETSNVSFTLEPLSYGSDWESLEQLLAVKNEENPFVFAEWVYYKTVEIDGEKKKFSAD